MKHKQPSFVMVLILIYCHLCAAIYIIYPLGNDIGITSMLVRPIALSQVLRR